MVSFLLSILLYPSPKMAFSDHEIAQYDQLASTIHEGRLIHYQLPFHKARFLMYLSLKGKYVFHGSNNQHIERFAPREQTLYNGELTKAVFASSDPIWSMFFAIFNRSRLVGSFRNGCIIGRKKKYYFFSINESTMKNEPWTEGAVYLLPRDQFTASGQGKLQFDELISREPIIPIGKIHVSLDDFWFRHRIAMHKDNESLLKTWLLYKARTLIGNP
ncbi:hypothetical protein GXP70_15295 [Paenibacillus lycopersici]|uniref:Uncharacterized protein n=1 Tax=Paenibacillus lycopersici TaxID=2704462 RepID=A0A6C0FWT5_9BACL|nr:hypothetical protein [Paenibacillus lycopersici]QHT61187.1 hypothetical protein GXP70_15295 [Paenibacillus lycopersici]